MTLTRFVAKSAFRNRLRSVLTVFSITLSLVLLTLMMGIWKMFYLSTATPGSELRLVVRHRVSLVFPLPEYYTQKIQAIPGVSHVVPVSWFGGVYKDMTPKNFFARFGTDPQRFSAVYPEFKLPEDQLTAWQRDRAGCIADAKLAARMGWKLGDRLFIKGDIYPVNLELTIRGLYDAPTRTESVYFNMEYVNQAVPLVKGRIGTISILADNAADVPAVAAAVDAMFKNAPQPTKTETEQSFRLGFINSLGNVKAFILSICSAVVFAILLVAANTMAMSIRERIREVAVLKTLGFTRGRIAGLLVGESVAIAVLAGLICAVVASLFNYVLAWLAQSSGFGLFLSGMHFGIGIQAITLLVAIIVGVLSSWLPSLRASKMSIVDGLRYVG